MLALKLRSVDNSFDGLPRLIDPASMRCGPPTRTGRIMAKSKKQPKAQKRKAAKRTVAKAKPAPVKKAAWKVKQDVAPVGETVAAEVIEQPTPGVITVTEVEETRQVS